MKFFKTSPILHLIWAVCFTAFCQVAAAQQSRPVSQFNPASITLGQNAQYVVTLAVKSSRTFKPPVPAGLELTYLGPSQSSQSTYANGKFETRVQTSFTFQAKVQATGTYKVPAYSLKLEGKTYSVPAATLTVLPPDGKTQVTLEEAAFLKLVCPESPIYVGQVARCVLNLYVLTAFSGSRNTPPTQLGDAFAQGAVDEKGVQSGERIKDLNYNKVGWPVTFIPLKSGPQTIEYQMVVEITVPRTARSSRNDFFDSFFNPRSQRQQLNVTTREITLDILPLPEEGQPESFSGALGKFKATQSLSAEEMNAGDPLTLTLKISGQGNFERIQAPEIEVGQSWKTYTPKAEFSPRDSLNFRGSKTFEYVLIPQHEGIEQTPEIHFSYFDPELESYAEIAIPAVSITVNPAPVGTATITAIKAESNERFREKTLLPIELFPGNWVATLRPVFLRPQFLGWQAGPLIFLSGFIYIRKRQLRLREDFHYARNLRAGKSMRRWLAKSKKAASSDDAEAFFAAAQRSIQESLSRHFKQSPDTLTQSEILEFLDSKEVESELAGEVGQFFQTADALKFAGAAADSPSLKEREKSLAKLVSQLTGVK